MKAIVTGGAGFIGSHLAERLIHMGVKTIILDDLSSGYDKNIPSGAIFRHVDISNWDELLLVEDDFKDCDVIFHNAASKKNICLRDPVRDLAVNSGGTLMLLQLAERNNVLKFVHTSTGSVVGSFDGTITEEAPTRPVSYYGVSKLAGERYVQVFRQMYGLNTTVIRPHHIFGTRQESLDGLGGVIAIFKRRITEGKPVYIFGDGNQQRLFTHVTSLVDANIEAWINPISTGKIYNVATEEKTTINELAKMMGAEHVIYEKELPGDIHKFDMDNSLIRKELGIKFMKLKDGLKVI